MKNFVLVKLKKNCATIYMTMLIIHYEHSHYPRFLPSNMIATIKLHALGVS